MASYWPKPRVWSQYPDLDQIAVKSKLAALNINVSISKGAGNLVSYRQRNLDAVVRASVHYYNTENEVKRFVEALGEIIGS